MIRLNYMDTKLHDFNKNYGMLIAVTYRMLGSFTEAEEIVQEVAIEWLQTDKASIQNPKAWLMKVCTNKTLDLLKKAYKKREVYPGTWLPEVLPNSLITWEDHLEKKDSLNTSFLVLLESLSPKERAVYILKTIFEYSFDEISEFTNLTNANCRKISQRANAKINTSTSHQNIHSTESISTIQNFFNSAQEGDKESLKQLLSPESEFWSDGGGKASAVKGALYGPDKIARFFANIFKHMKDGQYDYTNINNKPGLVVSKQLENRLWVIQTIFSFEIKNNQILKIYAQRNPDKLELTKKFFKKELSTSTLLSFPSIK